MNKFLVSIVLLSIMAISSRLYADAIDAPKNSSNGGVDFSIDITQVASFLSKQLKKIKKKDIDIPLFISNELIVVFSKPPSRLLIEAKGVKLEEHISLQEENVYLARVSFDVINDQRTNDLESALMSLPNFLWLQKNYIFQNSGISINLGDVMSSGKKPKLDSSLHYPIPLIGFSHKIDAGLGKSVVIIDGRMDLQHKELKGANIEEILLVDGPVDWHATAIASALVGREKIPGLIPAAKLISLVAFKEKAYAKRKKTSVTNSFTLAKAMKLAIQRNPNAINLSFSGPKDRLLKYMVDNAVKKNIAVIAAAGNGGASANMGYPGAIDTAITVTALNRNRKIYKHATRGLSIDIAAPGVDIFSASINNKYKLLSGTSFACAYVTAAAVLKPDFSAASVSAFSQDLGEKGHDKTYGHGLLKF